VSSVVAGSVPTINPPAEPGAAPVITPRFIRDTTPIWHRLLVRASDGILQESFSSDEMHPWSDQLHWDAYSAMVDENVSEVYNRHISDQAFFPEEEQHVPEAGEPHLSTHFESPIHNTPFKISSSRTSPAW
jgi:hypothetical protein